jgi:hypothetical protein
VADVNAMAPATETGAATETHSPVMATSAVTRGLKTDRPLLRVREPATNRPIFPMSAPARKVGPKRR